MLIENKTNIIDDLQSFRGLAAIVVLVHHCTFYFSNSYNLKFLSEMFFNAHGAVVAFYVLSGYVLTLSLMKNELRLKGILSFYLKRCFRIYPLLWLACVIGFLYLLIFKGIPTSDLVSDWWNKNYRDDNISFFKVFLGFLGFGHELPLPIWSISLELVGSLLIPLFVLLLKRKIIFFNMFLFILFILSIYAKNIYCIYIFFFILGSSIVLWKEVFEKIKNIKIILFLSLFFLIFGRQLGGWNYLEYYHNSFAALIEGFAAAIVIAIIVSGRIESRLLKAKQTILLGDISYSVYLLHLPIMAFIAEILEYFLRINVIPNNTYILTLLLLVITLFSTLFLSYFTYYKIEKYGIQIGKDFSNKLIKHRSL